MPMASTAGWRSLAAAAAVLGVLACTEQLSAPGQCPELCPGEDIQVVDTLLTGIVANDSSFRGYTLPHQTPMLIVSDEDSARSVAVVRMFPRPSRIFRLAGDTVGEAIRVDSVRMVLRLVARDTAVNNLRVLIYRLPRTLVDSTTTFDTIQPHFTPANLVDSIPVHDDSLAQTLVQLIPPAAVEPDTVDSGIVAIGLDIRADGQTSVTFETETALIGTPPSLRYHVTSAVEDSVKRIFTQTPTFDTFVQAVEPGTPPATAITVGNLPSARAVVRFAVPRALVDSTTVVRATLLLTPVRPATGRPGERFDLEAVAILRDFGGKSVILPDLTVRGFGSVVVGSTDTIPIEIGPIVRFWRTAGDSIPRAIILRNLDERLMLGEIQVGRGNAGAAAPRLRLTYVPRYRFGVP